MKSLKKSRAHRLANLPDTYKAKKGMTSELATLGKDVMSEAAEADATMLSTGRDHPERAALSTEFMPQTGHLADAMDEFDKELEKAEIKRRRFDKHGLDEDGDFAAAPPGPSGTALTRYQGDPWVGDQWANWEEDWSPSGKKPRVEKQQKKTGEMLDEWGCYVCDEGLIFGIKYLVTFSTETDPDAIAALAKSTCVGKLSYLRSVERRHEWCSHKGKCKDHDRPDGFNENHFVITNLHSRALQGEEAAVVKRVLAKQSQWVHVAGAKNLTAVLGGAPNASTALVVPTAAAKGSPRQKQRYSPYSGGKGKGKGKSQGKGKGKPSGKGKRGQWHF